METSTEIKKQVDQLLKFCSKRENLIKRRDDIDSYKQLCMTEFTTMHSKYPSLFFCIVENPTTFPYYRFSEMLSYKEKIEKEEITENDASVQIGNKYFREFVKETITDLDKEKGVDSFIENKNA